LQTDKASENTLFFGGFYYEKIYFSAQNLYFNSIIFQIIDRIEGKYFLEIF
jgi:hypothetical protein